MRWQGQYYFYRCQQALWVELQWRWGQAHRATWLILSSIAWWVCIALTGTPAFSPCKSAPAPHYATRSQTLHRLFGFPYGENRRRSQARELPVTMGWVPPGSSEWANRDRASVKLWKVVISINVKFPLTRGTVIKLK